MRVHSALEDTILQTRNYKTVPYILLGDTPTFDCFISGSIEANVSNPVITATFNLHLGKGITSISPLLSTSRRNAAGTGPSVDIASNVILATSCVAPGEDPVGAMRYVFRGKVDDYSLTGDDILTIKCRDIFGQTVQDRWIDNIQMTDQGAQYGFPVGANRVDDAMSVIVAFTNGSGLLNPGTSGPDILVRGTPELAIGEYWQEQMSLMDALRRIGCLTTGWDLRGMWDGTGLDEFDLVYYNPDREKTVSYITHISNYLSLQFNSSIANVRNICDVIPANDARFPERAQNNISIAKYGRRFAGLSEDLSSHIDTTEEAASLALIMQQDLDSPPVDVQVEMPYNWLFEVNDLFRIEPDGFMYDADNIYAVTGYTHTFGDDGSATTTLTGSLAPRAAVREWFDGRKRSNKIKLTEPSGPGLEGDVWFQPDDLTLPTVI